MGEAEKQSVRIQTSILTRLEKKTLVWLANRLPASTTSDQLTLVGFIGSVIIGAGYVLSGLDIHWLWLSNFGFVVNWFGDSLDGTVARVRKEQRPVYGYYLDHSMDMINECFMFIGIGLSPFVHLPLAMAALVLYLMLTVSQSYNSHLRSEFKLTYAKLGPTEFRLIIIALNTIFMYVTPLNQFRSTYILGCQFPPIDFTFLDYAAITIDIILGVIFISSFFKDLAYFAKVDPKKKHQE